MSNNAFNFPSAGLVVTPSSIGERIEWLLQEKGWKQIDLARAIGATGNAIHNLVRNHSKQPSSRNLLKIADALSANADWIIYGKGDPWIANQMTDAHRELFRIYNGLGSPNQQVLLQMARTLALNEPR